MRSAEDNAPIDTLELVEELQLNQVASIEKMRISTSRKISSEVTLALADASRRSAGPLVVARTSEVSREDFQVVSSAPLRVGDIYFASFDRSSCAVNDAYVLCESCNIVSEGSFAAGLRFFVPIELPDAR